MYGLLNRQNTFEDINIKKRFIQVNFRSPFLFQHEVTCVMPQWFGLSLLVPWTCSFPCSANCLINFCLPSSFSFSSEIKRCVPWPRVRLLRVVRCIVLLLFRWDFTCGAMNFVPLRLCLWCDEPCSAETLLVVRWTLFRWHFTCGAMNPVPLRLYLWCDELCSAETLLVVRWTLFR